MLTLREGICIYTSLTLLTKPPGPPTTRLNKATSFLMGLQQNSGPPNPALGLANQVALSPHWGPAQSKSQAMARPSQDQGAFCPSPSYHRGPAGDELDRVLHLLLGHLHHAAVLLLGGKGLLPIFGHPGVQLWSREGGEESGPQAETPSQQGAWTLHQQSP